MEFLSKQAMKSQQLYLLGDLFEYWAGDDDISSPYLAQIIDALRAVSDAGIAISWIGGNRDFLVGKGFAHAVGATLLQDPFVVEMAGQRIALAHGDAQCTDDVAYMAFRAQVRDPTWQQDFLARPLAQRKSIIEGLRTGSREAQREKSYEIMDVNEDAVLALFNETGTSILIHGHTHRPGAHVYRADGIVRTRYVLPDWDCETDTRRGGWIAVTADGSIKQFSLDAM